MEAYSALLAICVGNSPVTGEFTSQGPVMRSCDVFFDLYEVTVMTIRKIVASVTYYWAWRALILIGLNKMLIKTWQ